MNCKLPKKRKQKGSERNAPQTRLVSKIYFNAYSLCSFMFSVMFINFTKKKQRTPEEAEEPHKQQQQQE